MLRKSVTHDHAWLWPESRLALGSPPKSHNLQLCFPCQIVSQLYNSPCVAVAVANHMCSLDCHTSFVEPDTALQPSPNLHLSFYIDEYPAGLIMMITIRPPEYIVTLTSTMSSARSPAVLFIRSAASMRNASQQLAGVWTPPGKALVPEGKSPSR